MLEILATAAELEVALSKVPRLGPVCFRRSESDFGDRESALNAGYNELKTGLEDRPSQEIVAAGNNSSSDDEMAALERAGVTTVTWDYSGYSRDSKRSPTMTHRTGRRCSVS